MLNSTDGRVTFKGFYDILLSGDGAMNNKKTGQFISVLRKELNYSQKDLADKLNVTDKAVSKWETAEVHLMFQCCYHFQRCLRFR